MVVLVVLCLGVKNLLCCLRLIYVFIDLVKFRKMSDHLLRNSCPLGLQYVYLVQVSNYRFVFPTSGFAVGLSF